MTIALRTAATCAALASSLALAFGQVRAAPPEPAAILLQEAVRECVEAAREREPSLEAHGMAQYVARGNRVLGVVVSLPQAAELAACLERLPSRPVFLHAPDANTPDAAAGSVNSVATGGFAVDVGGPRPPAVPTDFEHFLAERRSELRGLVNRLVRSGRLVASDPMIREILAPGRTARR